MEENEYLSARLGPNNFIACNEWKSTRIWKLSLQ